MKIAMKTRGAQKHSLPQRRSRRSAFTLVELLVVITIAGVLAAITLGSYRSIGEGQTRTSCQTNLNQIYSALRLYSSDYDGFAPYFDPAPGALPLGLGRQTNLGLWALYSLPSDADPNVPALLSETLPGNSPKPIGMYLRNPKQLHCPADTEHEDRFDLNNPDKLEMSYLSYQVQDGSTWTYQPRRVAANGSCPPLNLNPGTPPAITPLDRTPCRQLIRYQGSGATAIPLARTPDDTTVVTWCVWHRGARQIDNVLFYDGNVRPLAKDQTNPYGTGFLTDWNRVP